MHINKYIDLLFKNRSLIIKEIKNRVLQPYGNKWIIRPFVQSDLAPVPANWEIGPPGYIGIGTSKAGTTWWHQLILDHPQVVENRLAHKELNFFTHFLYSGITENDAKVYRQAFASPPGSICGEFTPGYLRTPLVAEYIHAAAPDAKLIAILRNPINQMQSAVNEFMRIAQNYKLRGARKKIFLNSTAVQNALTFNLIFPALQRYLNYFDRSQLLVLQYEKCALNPHSEINKTYEFLGIESGFKPPNLNNKINKNDYSIPKITSTQSERLVDYYREDVQSTVNLFPEIELTLWADFCK